MTDTPSRECGTCTACCEGWLHGVVRGHEMNRDKKCHFLGCKNTRCSIYEERPQEPCKNFNCVWLEDKEHKLPEWMKPELSKVILKEMEYEVEIRRGGFGTASYILDNAANLKNKGKFWYVVEMGETISGPVLNWLIQYALAHDMPLLYQVSGVRNVLGPPDFHAWAEQHRNRQF
jgi:hypothetical protein